MQLVILYFTQYINNKYSMFYIPVFWEFQGILALKPQHFNIMIVHAGLCHADSFMHEWHTQSSISYELRHVPLPLQANGAACITQPVPCTHSELWKFSFLYNNEKTQPQQLNIVFLRLYMYSSLLLARQFTALQIVRTASL